MQEYDATAVINASPAKVWSVLTDAAAYGEWNSEILGIDGRIALGERIRAQVKLGSGVVRKVGLRVTRLDDTATMEWTGGLPFGLFVGLRTFTVAPAGNGTKFHMHIRMSGPLASLIGKSVGDRQPEADSFAASLKSRAEQA